MAEWTWDGDAARREIGGGAWTAAMNRSAAYRCSSATARAARAKIAAQALWPDPIVTEISPLTRFYPAEGYHQDYFRKNPNQGYCTFVIKPKVKKLEQKGVIPKG